MFVWCIKKYRTQGNSSNRDKHILTNSFIYIIIIWRRNRDRSRFRAKLTILFLLFVFIPTVPLTFFIANLLTRSADILLIPGVGEALNTSLETIKIQIEEPGRIFLERYEELDREYRLLSCHGKNL